MIAALVAWAGGARMRRWLAGAGLFLLVLATLTIAKCRYDARLVADHDAAARADAVEADRRADGAVAAVRAADAARQASETIIIREAVDEARETGVDPRAAYYECVRRQQAAARAGRPPARC